MMPMEEQDFPFQEHLRQRMQLAIQAAENRRAVSKSLKSDANGVNRVQNVEAYIFDDVACQLAINQLIFLAIILIRNGIEDSRTKENLLKLISALGLDAVALYQLDHYEHLQVLYRLGDITQMGKNTHLPDTVGSPDGFIGSLWAKKSPIFVGDLGGGSGSVRSFIGLPLFVEERFLGAMVFLSSNARRFPALYKTILLKTGDLFAEFLKVLEGKNETAGQSYYVGDEQLRPSRDQANEIVHDFNNIFAAILGRTEILEASVEDQHLRDSLSQIETTALKGTQIVRRLQDNFITQTLNPPDKCNSSDRIDIVTHPGELQLNRDAAEKEYLIDKEGDQLEAPEHHSSKCDRISVDICDPTELDRVCRTLKQFGYSPSSGGSLDSLKYDSEHSFRCSIIDHTVYFVRQAQINKLLENRFLSLIIIGPEGSRQKISQSMPQSALYIYIASPYRNHQILHALKAILA